MTEVYSLPYARVDWRSAATPFAPEYADIYWSRDQGPAEKQHVYITGNHLQSRFRDLKRQSFTIVELGFGFGLNFLLTLNAWRAASPADSILHYYAVEKSCVSPGDMYRLYSAMAPAKDRLDWQRLLSNYPLPVPGQHGAWLDHNVCLHLCVGAAAERLKLLNLQADCWFLDGFTPGKNPDLWNQTLYADIARLSKPGTSLSTYSVAGHVRRGLSDAGFKLTTQPGFNQKRDMLTGEVPGTCRPTPIHAPAVAIIGGGLTGLLCAQALRRRNIQPTFFDTHGLLAGASAIPWLTVAPRLAVRPDTASLLSLMAFQYCTPNIDHCGLLKLAHDAETLTAMQRVAALCSTDIARLQTAADIKRKFGYSSSHAGLYYPRAGLMAAASLIDASSAALPVLTRTVSDIIESDSGVSVITTNGETHGFDHVILATGAGPLALLKPLDLIPVRGQAISVSATHSSAHRQAANTIISAGKSVFPMDGDGRRLVSGTYLRHSVDTAIRQSDTDELVAGFSSIFSGNATGFDAGAASPDVTQAFTGIRATSRDRQPVVGHLPHWHELTAFCERKTPRGQKFDAFRRRTSVCVGFGSHGATLAPLSTEHLVRQITGEPPLLPTNIAATLAGERFQLRRAGKFRTH